jgi:FHA domain
MARCPDGHESSAADYCDSCGIRMDEPVPEARGEALTTTGGPLSSLCPNCGAPGAERFCEACGFDMRETTWKAMVRASRQHYDAVMAMGVADSNDIEFPANWPEREFRLSGLRLRIGRKSASLDAAPELDLTGPPTDPGVSHLHAILISMPGGSWAVKDAGSENGTMINGREIPAGQLVPLANGDSICIGAWTAITIIAVPSH